MPMAMVAEPMANHKYSQGPMSLQWRPNPVTSPDDAAAVTLLQDTPLRLVVMSLHRPTAPAVE